MLIERHVLTGNLQRACWKLLSLAVAGQSAIAIAQSDWVTTHHDAGGQRHSTLSQINTKNVSRLAPAWSFALDEGAVAGHNWADSKNLPPKSTTVESVPLVVHGVMCETVTKLYARTQFITVATSGFSTIHPEQEPMLLDERIGLWLLSTAESERHLSDLLTSRKCANLGVADPAQSRNNGTSLRLTKL